MRKERPAVEVEDSMQLRLQAYFVWPKENQESKRKKMTVEEMVVKTRVTYLVWLKNKNKYTKT